MTQSSRSPKRLNLPKTIQIIGWTVGFLVVATCQGCVPPDGQYENRIENVVSAPVTVPEIDTVFRLASVDDVLYGLNEVKKSSLDEEVIQMVLCAYENCAAAGAEWHWETLSDSLVRINLLDVLVQAGSRGVNKIDVDSLRLEVLEQLVGSGEKVTQQSMLILSYLGNADDADVIADTAINTSDLMTYRYAVIALKREPSGAYRSTLQRVLRESDASKRQSVEDLVGVDD